MVHLFSVIAGALLSAALPTKTISIVGGVAFLCFAVWTVRGDRLDDLAGRRIRLQQENGLGSDVRHDERVGVLRVAQTLILQPGRRARLD